jgi:hypothetical protein
MFTALMARLILKWEENVVKDRDIVYRRVYRVLDAV